MKVYIRWANVLFFTVLLANLVMPPGMVHRALADDPPQEPPPDWPFGLDFITQTWEAVHETLFGPVEEGQHTAFYPTNSVIKGIGVYTGQNNTGAPFTLHVVRHYQYTAEKFSTELSQAQLDFIAASGDQGGLFWGTMSTSLGSVNVIGFSMSVGPGTSNTGDPLPPQGILPLIDFDVLMAAYLPVIPSVQYPGFGFPSQFDLMMENWEPPLTDPTDGDLCAFIICDDGTSNLWCPMQDPLFLQALAFFTSCVAAAAVALADALALINLLVRAQIAVCYATAAAIAPCCAAAIALSSFLILMALATFAAAVAACAVPLAQELENSKDRACDQ